MKTRFKPGDFVFIKDSTTSFVYKVARIYFSENKYFYILKREDRGEEEDICYREERLEFWINKQIFNKNEI